MTTKLKPQTDIRAASIQQRLKGPAKAIDPTLMLGILRIFIPTLIDCFDPSDGAEAAEYVKRRYNPHDASNEYGGYDKRLVKAAARAAKRAARKNGTRITWDQAYELGLKTLDDIREGDDQQTSLVIRENGELQSGGFMLI